MPNPQASICVSGQSCPMPLIELAKAAKKMQPGEVLKITGDDPIFEVSVRDFCRLGEFNQGHWTRLATHTDGCLGIGHNRNLSVVKQTHPWSSGCQVI